jgi:hypothetical protein
MGFVDGAPFRITCEIALFRMRRRMPAPGGVPSLIWWLQLVAPIRFPIMSSTVLHFVEMPRLRSQLNHVAIMTLLFMDSP